MNEIEKCEDRLFDALEKVKALETQVAEQDRTIYYLHVKIGKYKYRIKKLLEQGE